MKSIFWLMAIILNSSCFFTSENDKALIVFGSNQETTTVVQLTNSFKKTTFPAFVSAECIICFEKLYDVDCYGNVHLSSFTLLKCGHMFHTCCANRHCMAKHKTNQLYRSKEPILCPSCNQKLSRIFCVGRNESIILAAIKTLHEQEINPKSSK